MNEQGSCYKCLCELFNIFWCFRVENCPVIQFRYLSIKSITLIQTSIIIDYSHRALSNFEKINRFLSIVIECYRLSILSNDYTGLFVRLSNDYAGLFCTLEAKFTLQAALSLFCDFGIFSQERTINFAFRE